MGWLFRSAEEKVLDRILDACDDGPAVYASGVTGRRPSGVLRQVVREMRKDGISPAEIITLIGLVIDLINKIGPLVKEILDAIRARRAEVTE